MKRSIVRITTVPVSLKVLLKGQLNFINSSNAFEVIGISSGGRELDEVASEENIKCYALEMTRKINPLADFFAIIRLYLLLSKINPHIVHTHTPKAGMIGMIAASFAGVPFKFHTVAGLPLMAKSGLIKYILLKVEKITYRFSDLVLPNSYGLMNYIIKNKLTSENKIKVIGNGSSNGINLEYFQDSEEIRQTGTQIRNSLGIRNSDFIFLFIGRIVNDKGVNELLYAFTKLQQEYDNIKLIMVGNYEESIYPLNQDSKLIMKSKNIFHVGYQKDVRPYYSLSDAFVLPTYREGFPNVILQACAFNLPCIVTDINGCNEIISDNVNGLIIPKKDHNALYNAMKKFMADPSMTQKLGTKSRAMIKAKYDQAFFWGEVSRLYETTI